MYFRNVKIAVVALPVLFDIFFLLFLLRIFFSLFEG
jgi:hypothetical protein